MVRTKPKLKCQKFHADTPSDCDEVATRVLFSKTGFFDWLFCDKCANRFEGWQPAQGRRYTHPLKGLWKK